MAGDRIMVDFNNIDEPPEPGPTSFEEAPAAEPVAEPSTIKSMMMSTSPSKPLEDVEDPWAPEKGGITRIYRGLQKALGVAGTPAVMDIAIGSLEVFIDTQEENGDGDELEDDFAEIDSWEGDE